MFADVDNLSEYVGEIDDSLLDVERSLDVGVVSIPDDSEASSASQELSLPPHPCHHATARGSVIKGCSGDSGAISVGEEVDGIDSTASYLTSTHYDNPSSSCNDWNVTLVQPYSRLHHERGGLDDVNSLQRRG